MIARAEHAFSPRENFVWGCSPLISSCGISTGCWSSCDEDASATGLLDSLLSSLGEELSLNDHWDLWENSFTEDLEVSLNKHNVKKTSLKFYLIFLLFNIAKGRIKIERETYGFGNINHRCLVLGLFSSFSCLFRDKWPQLVGVDSWAMFPVSLQVENSHTRLSIVSRMAKKKIKHSFYTYYLFIMILSWCIPPASPLPPGLFLCLPTLPWPMETWPLICLVFFNLAT